MRLLIAKLAATSVRSVSFALNNDADIAELATDLDSCVRLLRASEYDLVVLMVSEDQVRARDAIAHIRAEVGRVPMVVLTEPGGADDSIPANGFARERATPVVVEAATDRLGRQTHAPHHDEPRDRSVPWRWEQHTPSDAARRRAPVASLKQGTLPIGGLKGAIDFTGGPDGLRVDGTTVPLSQAELRIFTALWEARGAIVSADDLLDAIYGEQERPASRVLPVFLFKLRRKLDAMGVGEAIETEVGRGVRLRADAVPDQAPDQAPGPVANAASR